jgi:hypothetical protein
MIALIWMICFDALRLGEFSLCRPRATPIRRTRAISSRLHSQHSKCSNVEIALNISVFLARTRWTKDDLTPF